MQLSKSEEEQVTGKIKVAPFLVTQDVHRDNENNKQ